jgi:iron complex outermembrane recepter protein
VVPQSGFSPGERLPEVPKINGSAGVQFNFSLGTTWSGFLRADYVHVGSVRVKFPAADPADAVVLTQDAFDTANLRLSFQRGPLGLDLFGTNLSDERGIVNTGDPDFGARESITRPREVGVELRYSF